MNLLFIQTVEIEVLSVSISVQEAINLPVLNSAKLLAGTKGIHNQIKWVTIVEVIEDISRFQDGEFLITTGYGLNEDSTQFQKLLALKKLSGVAIYSGFYLEEIPEIFLEIANSHQLPLIELPTHLNFSTITKSILQQILNKQMEEENKLTEIRQQEEFLEDIINKNFHSLSLILDRGKKLGYNLSLPQSVFQIRLADITKVDAFSQQMDLLSLHCSKIISKKKRQFMIRTRLDELIILSEIKSEKKKSLKQDCFELANEILENWKLTHPNIPILIGIGKTYSNVNQLSDSANEAKYAVDLSKLLFSQKEIVHYDDLATFHLLLQMKEMGISLQQFYEEHIGELIKKSEQGVDLLGTLDAYFNNNLNLQSTAAYLFIHRHTLKYRLQQIQQKSGHNLNSADERLTLQLAIVAYKMERYFTT